MDAAHSIIKPFLPPVRIDLLEYSIHKPSYQYDFPIWDRHGSLILNAAIKPLDQLFHAEILVQAPGEEITHAKSRVPEVLLRVLQWRNEIREITFICATTLSDSRSSNDVRGNRSRGTENAQLVYSLNLS